MILSSKTTNNKSESNQSKTRDLEVEDVEDNRDGNRRVRLRYGDTNAEGKAKRHDLDEMEDWFHTVRNVAVPAAVVAESYLGHTQASPVHRSAVR